MYQCFLARISNKNRLIPIIFFLSSPAWALQFTKPPAGTAGSSTSSSPSRIVLPIEVLGPTGYTATASVNLSSVSSGGLRLWMQIHGLEYEKQASVQVNNGAWIPLDHTKVALEGLAQNYGGIGGGFHTLRMTVSLPSGAVVKGTNYFRFRFNGTDGQSSGFRVLAFNVLRSDGASLISSSNFIESDPNTWKAPLGAAADIAAGERLWRTASLRQPVPGGSPRTLRAKCADCHTQDGRDLKYFNYSNQSIQSRAVFHGLSAHQGNQIASYIRSLRVPNPGRPWNPPYQPGPGLDAKPVEYWAAGAGLKSVLTSDIQGLSSIAPTQTAADFSSSGNINTRETPIALQLPDWNRWLPQVHPLDTWGDAFANSKPMATYKSLRSSLIPNDPRSYDSVKYTLNLWIHDRIQFKIPRQPADGSTAWANPQTARSIYSLGLWQLVKEWELNQEFGLEDMARTVFGPTSDARSWYTNDAFNVSPHKNTIPSTARGILNDTPISRQYISYAWYHLQLVLNNARGRWDLNPIDWPYFYGFSGTISRYGNRQPLRHLFLLRKGLELSYLAKGPEAGPLNGWNFAINDPSRLVHPDDRNMWSALPPATAAAVLEGYLTSWFNIAKSFSPQRYYSGGFTSATEAVNPYGVDGNMASKIAYMIPQFRHLGVSPALMNRITDWAATMWPRYNWNSIRNATCTAYANGYVRCTPR